MTSSVCDNLICREHMTWLDQHPNFQKDMKTHKLFLVGVWKDCERLSIAGKLTVPLEKALENWFIGDMLEQKKLGGIANRIRERERQLVASLKNPEINYAFITIGYNEQTVTPAVMMMIGQKVASMKYWDTCKMVHEKHCSTGIHHHTHFLVTYSESMPKSKIVQYVYQLCNKFILGKNFIDIKGTSDKSTSNRLISEFERYIIGDKSSEKLQYVEQDILWRKENNMN